MSTAREVGRRVSVVDGIQLHRLVSVLPLGIAVVYVKLPWLLLEVGEVQEVEVRCIS